MIKTVIVSGSTARLSCKFTNFKGEVSDPDIVKLTVYDYKYRVLQEHTVTEKDEIGEYVHYLITNVKPQTYIVEWYGEIDGFPSIHREQFITKQMTV